MNAHTFVVPPFFITTGAHYVDYRVGSNILRGVCGVEGLYKALDAQCIHASYSNFPDVRVCEVFCVSMAYNTKQ